jgi:hypothetical protein
MLTITGRDKFGQRQLAKVTSFAGGAMALSEKSASATFFQWT